MFCIVVCAAGSVPLRATAPPFTLCRVRFLQSVQYRTLRPARSYEPLAAQSPKLQQYNQKRLVRDLLCAKKGKIKEQLAEMAAQNVRGGG